MIHELATIYCVRELCEALGVSRSGYYAWHAGGRGSRAKANTELAEHIKDIHKQSRGTYGSPRVTRNLEARGLRCGHNRVAGIMRSLGLKGAQKAPFRPRTTNSKHDQPISPNRLGQGLQAMAPNQIWVADITYIPTKNGWTYLSAFMDLATRAIKGWTLRDTLKTEVVIDAFNQAVSRFKPDKQLIVHSDRGCQYASQEFRKHLELHNVLSSMSRKGNCYDNAAMESFWATLKTEMRINQPFETKEQARLAIFDYIETFYNTNRLHSSIGYNAPLALETKFNEQSKPQIVSAISG